MAAAKRKASSREPVEKSPAPAGAGGGLDRFFGLAASALGTSTTTAYIESAAGVEEGAAPD